MAAITSAGSGDWNSTTANAPWPSGIVPVSGDTVTISSGHTVTIPAGYTAVCGTSPTNNSGTVALTINGPLVINGTLKFQGPVRQGNATVTVGAGGTVTYDASGAATPASAAYVWEMQSGSSQANAKIVCNGSSGSHCTFNSQGNVSGCRYGINSTNWSDSGRFEATYTDFSYLGSSSVDFIQGLLNTSVGVRTFSHCTFDNCGQINTPALGAAAVFQFNHCKVTNPANTSYTLQTTVSAAISGGTREILNSDIAGRVYFLMSGTNDSGFTFKNNISRPYSITATSTSEPVHFTGGCSAAAWDQNFAFFATNSNSADPTLTIPCGTCSNTYIIRLVNPSYSNAHPISFRTVASNLTASGWIVHYTGADVNSDWFQYGGADAASARALTISNTIFMGNAVGDVCGALYNNDGGSVQSNTVVTFDHNTIIGANEPTAGNVFGVGAEAVTNCLPAGSIASISSNIKYSGTSKAGLIAQSAAASAAANAITSADYNAVYNISTSIYAGTPSGQFAGTPGTHDITADPQFYEPTRSLLNFDQGYLGQPVGTAWANSTAYAVGDVVSASTSTFFGSATYNYRCVSAHTSATATDKPGSGSAWVAKWEPAAVKLISDDVVAGNTYSGGTNSLIGELVAWVKAGYAPTNAALQYAGHDGVTIGAVEFASSGGGGIYHGARMRRLLRP